jgi:predicted TIM-barrel fold metal-dependent hydrolase
MPRSSVEPVEPVEPVETIGALGLPGLFDLHTHFLPPRVRAKVVEQFDSAGPLIGRPWPLAYRGTDESLVETLRGFGVRRFSALAYAHRPEMAEWLNDWTFGFADRVPEALRCATFFPEPAAAAYVAGRLEAGAELWKVHVQVGAFDVRHPLLDEVWGLLAEAGAPVVLHAGSGPVGTEFTGPEPVAGLLRRHPSLRLVIAHAGAPEYAEFLDLAEQHEHVGLDTTMAFTDFFDDVTAPYPAELLPRLRDLGLAGRVFLGTDFPNIPYPYATQLEALVRLDLGDDWLRAVCWHNAAALTSAG